MYNNYAVVGKVHFPRPDEVNINMMPFIMGDRSSLPDFVKQYYPIIQQCPISEEELGEVGYLTVSEGIVQVGKSQRRGGIHVEKHPGRSWGGTTHWGGLSGLFMASSVEGSTMVWDRHIETPGEGGDCSHLESELGEGRLLKSGELVWMTDSCPHASMPVKEDCYRQFFRVVTSEVDIWYKKHSTSNPLGVKPNAEIITTSKF